MKAIYPKLKPIAIAIIPRKSSNRGCKNKILAKKRKIITILIKLAKHTTTKSVILFEAALPNSNQTL